MPSVSCCDIILAQLSVYTVVELERPTFGQLHLTSNPAACFQLSVRSPWDVIYLRRTKDDLCPSTTVVERVISGLRVALTVVAPLLQPIHNFVSTQEAVEIFDLRPDATAAASRH